MNKDGTQLGVTFQQADLASPATVISSWLGLYDWSIRFGAAPDFEQRVIRQV